MEQDDFLPDYASMSVERLLQSMLNAAGIDALANTPDYELVERMQGLPALEELKLRVEEVANEKDYDNLAIDPYYCEQCNDYHDDDGLA